MLRRLSRLLIIALVLAVVAYAVSKLMGGDDDDFDDFDDLDSGFEFQETPVEIDVPVSDTVAPDTEMSSTPTIRVSKGTGPLDDISQSARATASIDTGPGRLIDINGIGPAYEARLHSIGIGSIHDLAQADAELIASQIEVIGGAATVGDWIDQARMYHNSGQS
jgi:predicted flap endonuclease-1-like 5' DNA nuclease